MFTILKYRKSRERIATTTPFGGRVKENARGGRGLKQQQQHFKLVTVTDHFD